jgi:hypothetical protein
MTFFIRVFLLCIKIGNKMIDKIPIIMAAPVAVVNGAAAFRKMMSKAAKKVAK